jgi:hypothetical protein
MVLGEDMEAAGSTADRATLGSLAVGAAVLLASVIYGISLLASAGAPPAAVQLRLPRVTARDLRISEDCSQGAGCASCVDCSCDEGEVALGGGGACPALHSLNESGLRYRSSNTDRFIDVWRVSCLGAYPQRAHVVCGTLTPF